MTLPADRIHPSVLLAAVPFDRSRDLRPVDDAGAASAARDELRDELRDDQRDEPRPGPGDWRTLLGRVRERFGQVVGLAMSDRRGRVARLDRLQATLAQALGERRRLERDVDEAATALAAAHAELAAAQAGERRARHRASHDELTSLPNRSGVLEQLEGMLQRDAARPPGLALLFIDLDGFKAINDAHGHASGDAVLRIVAAWLARAMRAEDVVGRLGGDEFVCVVSNLCDRESLGRLAGKVFDAVSAPLSIGALVVTVRPSIGIAACPADGTAADLLLRRADLAMYRAKRLQCGHAFFERCTEA